MRCVDLTDNQSLKPQIANEKPVQMFIGWEKLSDMSLLSLHSLLPVLIQKQSSMTLGKFSIIFLFGIWEIQDDIEHCTIAVPDFAH